MRITRRHILTALTLVCVTLQATPAVPLLSSPSSTVEGTVSSGPPYGSSVANAGDTNGDGYDDLVVGAPDYLAGTVYVYLGGPAGIVAADAATVLQSTYAIPGLFGTRVAGAGDVNGDGYDDILASGARGIFLFLGGPNGIPSGDESTAACDFDSLEFNPTYKSCAGAGDVNGDGYDDIVLGADRAALLYLGGPGGFVGQSPQPSTVISAAYPSAAVAEYWTVAGAGDVNGDGYDDVAIGTAGDSVLVFNGGPAGIVGTFVSTTEASATARIRPDPPGSWDDLSLDSAGDTNGDGYDDLVVGAPKYDGGRGAAFVFLGRANGIASGNERSASTILHPNRTGDRQFGSEVAGAGDVNGDGYDDVLVRTFDSAFLHLGGTALGVSRWAESIFTSPFGPAPLSIGGGGDVDADGFDDVLVGEPNYNDSLGRVLIYRGRPDDWSLFDYDYNAQWARTAEVGAAYDYGVWQDYPTGFARWTHVAAGARHLFFYNSSTGEAALGSVDATGAFTQLRYWAPGTSFGVGWTNVVWHGDELFFYASGNGLAAVGRFDGPDYAFHQYNAFNLLSGWTHVVSVQGYLLFYKQSNGTGYACQLNPVYNTTTGVLTQINFQYVRVQVYSSGWTHIVDSRNGVVFYNASNGGYRIGDFDRAGNLTTRTAPWPAWSAYPLWAYTTQRAGWTSVTAAGGRLLFYDKNTGQGVTGYVRTTAESNAEQAEPLARVETYPNGAISTPSTMKWSHVVPVAVQ